MCKLATTVVIQFQAFIIHTETGSERESFQPEQVIESGLVENGTFKIGVLNFPGIASCSPLIMSLKFNFMLMGPIDIVGMYLLAFVLMVEFNQFTPSFWKVTGASVSSH